MRETKYSQKLYKAIRKLNMDKEELKGTLLCLYVNGCSLEDCVRLFGASEEKVIRFLEAEELHGYKACSECGKLKDRKHEFRQCKTQRLMVCKICKQEHHKNYDKQHYQNNKEKIKENSKEYNNANKNQKKEYNKEYYENNKEKIKEYGKEYNEKNKNRRKEYRENNKEKLKEYRENNKNRRKEYNKKYYQQEASVELVQKLAKYETVSGNQIRCKYCGRWITPTIAQVNNRVQGLNENDKYYIYCSDECKEECPTFGQKKYPKGFKVASSREVNPVLRQIVLERDDYTCQKCGDYEDVRLHCHHVIPAVNSPMEADDPDTCTTLCKDCHEEVHQIPGCGYGELRCG